MVYHILKKGHNELRLILAKHQVERHSQLDDSDTIQGRVMLLYYSGLLI